MRLALGDNEPRDDDVLTSDRREPDHPAWQLLALLRERSAIDQALQSRGARGALTQFIPGSSLADVCPPCYPIYLDCISIVGPEDVKIVVRI